MGRGRKPGTEIVPKTGSWEVIERQFVQGILQETGEIYYPTLIEMCEAHELAYATIRRRMIDEKWMLKREKWQQKLHKWVHAATMSEYIEAAQKFDASCVEASQKAMNAIIAHLDESLANGEQVPLKTLDTLGRAAMAFQRVGRLALGLSTENSFSRIQEEQAPQVQVDKNLLSEREQHIIDTFLEKIEQTVIPLKVEEIDDEP